MEIPPIIQASMLKILRDGLLMIRYHAEKGDAQRCAIGANHLHNLPGLLDHFSIYLLKYYIEIETPQYLRETNNQVPEELRPEWQVLRGWLSQHHNAGPST